MPTDSRIRLLLCSNNCLQNKSNTSAYIHPFLFVIVLVILKTFELHLWGKIIKIEGIYQRLIGGQQEEIVEAYRYYREFLQLQSEELLYLLC